nr:tetratricopeptide repeat protein [Streptomyces sp. NBC_00899]WSX79673.1 tetratricopeptide repeat protein [Streptomyces sp. NBC_00899]
MRRRHVVMVLASASSVFSVLLAVAVNVATGGTLPGPVVWLRGWAWPLVAVQPLGDDRATADALLRLGQSYDHEGRVERGVVLLRQSVALWEAVGDPDRSADARRELGNLLRDGGRYDEAAEHLEASPPTRPPRPRPAAPRPRRSSPASTSRTRRRPGHYCRRPLPEAFSR